MFYAFAVKALVLSIPYSRFLYVFLQSRLLFVFVGVVAPNKTNGPP